MDQKSAAIETGRGSARSNRNATILIVEDSPVQAELLHRALVEAGYKVVTAANGAEGLALAKANRPDAVVSDINMPIMDGYNLCHAIRDDEGLKDTPVILLTMLSDPMDVIRGLNAGADGYVTKPYNVPTLVSRVESLLAYPPVSPPPVERRKAEIRLAGESHMVDAHSPRILNLLISTYENAVLQNRELAATQQALEELNEHLEQKVLEKTAELRKSEQRFRALIENASDLVLVIDAHGMITYVSPSVRRVGGYEPGELLGKSITAFMHPDDIPTALADLSALVHNPGKLHTAELRYHSKQGDSIILETVAKSAIDDPTIAGVVVNARDITGRKRAEEALARVNRALRTLSACNGALVHATSETELLARMCRIIVESGGYRLAWVGYAEHDEGKAIRPVAHYGLDDTYIERANITWADDETGRGPAGAAVRAAKPQIVVDAKTDPDYAPWREHAVRLEYGSVAAFPLISAGSTFGVICIYSAETNGYEQQEIKLLAELAGDLAYGINMLRSHIVHEQNVERLRKSMEGTIQAMAATLEIRDAYTAGHQRRVAELVIAIAGELKLPEEDVHALRLAAVVHDLGKIQVPAEILSKPGRLSPIEFELVKNHPTAGYDILKEVDFPWPIAQIVYQHHERLDGSGYPCGLKGDDILLGAKILAVADTVEAMSSHRPYRAAIGIDKALAEIEQGRGRTYDPAAVNACVKLFREQGFAFEKV